MRVSTIRVRKRHRPLSTAQRAVWRRIYEANGKAVTLTPTEQRAVNALVKRKWVTRLKSGKVRLASDHVQRPTWIVEASFFGLHWAFRTALARAVRGSVGSGFSFDVGRYDITWEAFSVERAVSIKEKLKQKIPTIRAKIGKLPRVRIKIYPPSKTLRKLASGT